LLGVGIVFAFLTYDCGCCTNLYIGTAHPSYILYGMGVPYYVLVLQIRSFFAVGVVGAVIIH